MDYIPFTVNGVSYQVSSDVDSDCTLNDFIRRDIGLSGTKFMCREGGCGACIVNVSYEDVNTGKWRTLSVNSCLVSITQCYKWDILTIEGIGNRVKGYHPVQKALAKYNGTQCGYCSSGWVMQMYSLLKMYHNDLTMEEVENYLSSNMCRCTGYRPILDAFKSFAKDAPPDKKTDLKDIEDAEKCSGKCKGCSSLCSKTKEWFLTEKGDFDHITYIPLKDHKKWFRVTQIKQIFDVLNEYGYDHYMLINGNTGKGAYPIFEYPDILIDISDVRELKQVLIDLNLEIGAGTTLTDTLSTWKETAHTSDGFQYLEKFYKHLQLVAHVPVRNIGTIAGNLMVKHRNRDFSSDVFLLLETCGAVLTLVNSKMKMKDVTMTEFLDTDMHDKVILKAKMPPLSKYCEVVTFKIMARAYNAHAFVNSGFLYHVDPKTGRVSDARIVYGGLSRPFVRAYKTEMFLKGKELFDNTTLQKALTILDKELIVEELPPEPSPEYRKKLAKNLFYKGLLQLAPADKVKSVYKSGGIFQRYSRPVSSGSQEYETSKSLWPINEPTPKVEALSQCTGEVKYVNDLPKQPEEVFGAFVLAKVGSGDIDKIDASFALKIPGVQYFFTAKDIPGRNTFTSLGTPFILAEERLLSNGKIEHFDQPVGIIVANTFQLAERAAQLVKVTYKNVRRPIQKLKEAITDPTKVTLLFLSQARDRGANVQRIIRGEDEIKGQYHFTFEVQSTITIPKEFGLEVNCSTQCLDSLQQVISEGLNIDQRNVVVKLPRIGGAYGCKITRQQQPGLACALVSYLTNKPCRFVLPIRTNMRAIGKRLPSLRRFEAGVNSQGEIQYLDYTIYDDNGCVYNETLLLLGLAAIKNAYDRERWTYTAFDVRTETASNTWFRGPGTLETVAMTEMIMERIAYELNLDPLEVRLRNISKSDPIPGNLINRIRNEAEFDKRKEDVRKFNEQNRWKKKGISLVPGKYAIVIFGPFPVVLTVYHGDGTIVLQHGGTEMGQGINTKLIAVCAYTLKLPTEFFRVAPYSTDSLPNSYIVGASSTTDSVCYSGIKCCQLLMERLAPIKEQFPQADWRLLVDSAYRQGILLQTAFNGTANNNPHYFVNGAAVAEVELDLLTGEHDILRVDILQECGLSVNPELDVGQIEGSYVMGVGYWTSEELVYDEKTGELYSDRTWNYHPPVAKDIPIDFRIKLEQRSGNNEGALSAKATSEPPITLAVGVAFALREAITASRNDSGYPRNVWYEIEYPYTLEHMMLAAEVKMEELVFK